MTDQTLADLAKRLHELVGKWETSASLVIENDVGATLDQCADELRALLPTPTPPTLADMTEEERKACQWMQADVANHSVRYVLANPCDEDGEAALVAADGKIRWTFPGYVTPRPDLPRMTWPGDQKPAPALPEGWRLADHPNYGRVIVTNPTPDVGGHVYFVSPAPSPIGNDWHLCTPAELTYIDNPGTPPSAEPAPEVHPGVTVGEPVTDPQVMLGISIDAPDGTVVVGHTPDCHPKATVKSGSTWQSTAGMRAHLYHALGAPDYSELESLTVVRWGKETDQ